MRKFISLSCLFLMFCMPIVAMIGSLVQEYTYLLEDNAFLKLERQEMSELINEQDTKLKAYETSSFSNLPIEEQFQIAGEIYDTDWVLPYSIAILETGNFTSNLFIEKNNPGGIKAGDGWASYDNQFYGVLEMTRLIKRSYIDKGYDTPEKMQPIYCPDGTNWADKVYDIMDNVKNNDNR